jgi:tetratricopeptide (TPR) repeat protein
LKEFDKAIDDFKKSMSHQCDASQNKCKIIKLFNLGEFMRRNEDYKAAGKYYSQAIAANTENIGISKIYSARSAVREKLNRVDEAIADFKSAEKNQCRQEHENDKCEIMYNNKIAELYLRQGNFKSALKYCDLTIMRQPEYLPAYFTRATIWEKKGDLKRAMDDYNFAIKSKPDEVSVYMMRALFKDRQGDLSGAIDDMKRASKTSNGYEKSKFINIFISVTSKKLQTAEKQ